MTFRHFGVILGLFFCAWAQGDVRSPRHVFTFHFSVEESPYSLHVVVPHFLTQSKNDLDDFVALFLKASRGGNVSDPWRRVNVPRFIQKWVLRHYREIGLLPKDPQAELSLALERTSHFDISRSSAAFVTPRGSKEILAIVRIDADADGESQLGLEQFLIERGAKSAPFVRETQEAYQERFEKNDFRLIMTPGGLFQFGMVSRHGTYPVFRQLRPPGAAAEILNFNLVKGSYDFLPLLYLTMEAFGASKWAGKRTSENSGSELLGIDNYYMHCEGEGRKLYFERKGWRVIDTYPNPHLRLDGKPVTNYVLTISRHDYKSTLEKTFTARDSFVNFLLTRFELDQSLRQQLRCERVLAQFGGDLNRVGPSPKLTLPGSLAAPAGSSAR